MKYVILNEQVLVTHVDTKLTHKEVREVLRALNHLTDWDFEVLLLQKLPAKYVGRLKVRIE